MAAGAERKGSLALFHERTKHSVDSVRSSPHFLDWENQPVPFRIYRDLPGEPLSLDASPSARSALATLLSPPEPYREGRALDRAALARLLYFSLGIVRQRRLADGRVLYFRAAPCTGALYHIDAYVVCGELSDLPAGVWHFGPHDFRLRRIRAGDFREAVVEACGGEAHLRGASAIVVLASTWWRNAWKYRSRAYRHVFWDSGTIVAQLLAQAAGDGWPTRLVVGFADPVIEKLCGLDPQREGAAALVSIGSGVPAGPAPRIETLRLETEPLSPREVAYPMIPEAHAAGCLDDGEAARRWRSQAPAAGEEPSPRGETFALPPPVGESLEPLETVIARRGSSRSFSTRAISMAALSTLLEVSEAPVPADYRADPRLPLVDCFLIVNAVEGLPPGAYRWHREAALLELLAGGDFRREAGFLGLGQELPAKAAVNLYTLADLDRVLGALGNRGYRAAQLDGAVAGGRTYLAAYAQRLGATGLTFFDDDVARFFGLDPQRWGVMFLTAVGHGRRP